MCPGGLNCSIRVRTAVRCCPEVEFEVGGGLQRVRGSVRVGVRVRNHLKSSREGTAFFLPGGSGSSSRSGGLPTGEGGGSVRGRVSSSSNPNSISTSGSLAFSRERLSAGFFQ